MIGVMGGIPRARIAGGWREHAGRWPRQPWFVDAFVVLATFGFSSLYVFSGTSISSLPTWVIILLTAAFIGSLAVRRRWPVGVFAWCFVVAAASGWWARQVVWSPALLVALYTVAALRPRRTAVAATVALTAGCVGASWHVIGDSGWLAASAALTAFVVTALVLGLYSGARHQLLAELHERARRLERERDQQGQLAAVAERARIAREMHDIVAHHLTAIVALSDGAAAQVRRAPDRAEAALAEVASTGRLALRETRHLLGVLRADPAAADLAPLPADVSVDELVERVRNTGLAVRYETTGDPSAASSGIRLCVYRVVQEALTNTMKHAGAGACATVRVQYGPAEIRVVAEDDGPGAAPLPIPPSGHGLDGMRERVLAFGGDVSSGPRAPHGWTVTARLPVGGAS